MFILYLIVDLHDLIYYLGPQAVLRGGLTDSQTGNPETHLVQNHPWYPISNAGYCMKLMEIADCREFDIPVKQAALVQLKQTIQKHWESKTYQIPE